MFEPRFASSHAFCLSHALVGPGQTDCDNDHVAVSHQDGVERRDTHNSEDRECFACDRDTPWFPGTIGRLKGRGVLEAEFKCATPSD